ncbi:MAG: ATP-binding protein [Coprothermobacter sp.]|nr:ATP-binding protein [Coprothermobacter sp.]
MKPFVAVARPHDDVLRDSLELDIFAANIWSVYNGEAPPEYQDSQIFESKTYKTRGLRNIVDVVRDRLEGRGGDPVIQLQTPFGGGKTHALIALYHMARDMGANVVVLAGDALTPLRLCSGKRWNDNLREKLRFLALRPPLELIK